VTLPGSGAARFENAAGEMVVNYESAAICQADVRQVQNYSPQRQSHGYLF
jgi:hypothetical protein